MEKTLNYSLKVLRERDYSRLEDDARQDNTVPVYR